MAFLYSVPKALVASAIILALALVAAANILSARYQIAGNGNQYLIYRLDRFTGVVTACMVDEDQGRAAVGKNGGIKAYCDLLGK